MSRAPWSPLAPLGQSLGVVVQARAVNRAGATITTLGVTTGTLTCNEDHHPRWSGTLGCQVPTDPAIVTALDPRLGVQIVVEAGYVLPGGALDVHHLATLDLDTANVRRPQQDLALTVVGRELRLIESQATERLSWAGGDTISTVLTTLFAHFDPSEARSIPPGLGFVGGDGIAIEPGESPWDAVISLAARAGLEVWHDAAGTWRVTPTPQEVGTPAATLSTGPGGAITGVEAVRTRTGWFNSLTIAYEWDQDGEARVVTGSAEVTAGPFRVSAVGRVHKRVVIPTIGWIDGAIDTAVAALARVASRGRALSVENAQPAWWLRAGDTVQIKHAPDAVELALAERVDFDLPTGTMHVTTRYPDPTTQITGG